MCLGTISRGECAPLFGEQHQCSVGARPSHPTRNDIGVSFPAGLASHTLERLGVSRGLPMRAHISIVLALAGALPFGILGIHAEAKESSRQCSAWKFDKEGGAEGEPAATLSCGNDSGFAVQCAGSFIANLRYYADAPGDD